jgi:hypothetical protein
LLAAFNQDYKENWEPKATGKDLKQVQFGQKTSMFKVANKQGMAVKVLSGIF